MLPSGPPSHVLSVDLVLKVLKSLLDDDTPREEVAMWARAYQELIYSHTATFDPVSKRDLLIEVVEELQAADLIVDGAPVFDDALARSWWVRLSQGLVAQ